MIDEIVKILDKHTTTYVRYGNQNVRRISIVDHCKTIHIVTHTAEIIFTPQSPLTIEIKNKTYGNADIKSVVLSSIGNIVKLQTKDKINVREDEDKICINSFDFSIYIKFEW